MERFLKAAAAAAAIAAGPSAPALAAGPVGWTDWQTAGTGAVQGRVRSDGARVAVTYAGSVAFAQTSGSGTDYFDPAKPYRSEAVPNAPPAAEMVAVTGGDATVRTITFARPVRDPVLAIVSLGRVGFPITWNFDRDFVVLSEGRGAFGSGPFEEVSGFRLKGAEGHGAIQFPGRVTRISFTVPVGEYWQGFTVGVPAPAAVAPGG